jgi:hypothetical protein
VSKRQRRKPSWRRNEQPSLFDQVESQRRKTEGMVAAAEVQPSLLELCRIVAVEIAMSRQSRTLTADDVGRVMKSRYSVGGLGPIGGSIFRGDNWQFTGDRIKSARISAHARELKVWKYIGTPPMMLDEGR